MSSSGQNESSLGAGDYLFWHSQKCDHCKAEDHEAQHCKSLENGPAGGHCNICGHGDHAWKKCRLVHMKKLEKPKNLTPAIYDYFTPLFRAKYAPQEEATLSGKSDPVAASPGSGMLASIPIRSVGSSSATAPNPSKQEESENVVEDPRAAQLRLWALAEKQLPKLPAGKSPVLDDENSAVVKANFFEIKLDANVGLFKYSITIEQQRPPSTGPQPEKKDTRRIKRETKRFLIEDYLRRNPPSHQDWATDWNSTIISKGQIYSENKLGLVLQAPSSNSTTAQSTNVNRPARLPLMTSLQLVGRVDLAGLKHHVEGKGQKPMEIPDEGLNALNIVSWKEITKTGSEVGRAGNKFYRRSQWRKGIESSNKVARHREAYFLRHGFFTSMRPGQDSVLVNVNTVTTAFLSPINLQEWIQLAFRLHRIANNTLPPPPSSGSFKLKLKTIRVTLDLHPNSRLWIICDISTQRIADLEFEKDDGSKEKVMTYLKASKSS